jgi:phage terminase large subunit-like protein
VSQRKEISEKRGHVASATASVREKQEARVFELGYPATPAFLWNNRPLYAIWKRYSKWLFEKRLLAYSDGAALVELCEAELAGQKERKHKALSAWKRPAFPEPVVVGKSLADFINRIEDERSSLKDRTRPEQTFCLDETGIDFEWTEGDPATVARKYAVDSVGSADVGELVKQACARFLHDLEQGHERGIFFDPVAVRNVVHFAKEFGGLPGILPWEVFVIAAIFGFKRATGLRVVTEAWLSVGRKNGKTRLAATIGLFLLVADLEKYAEVYVCATAKEQSRICWRDARRVVGDNPELAEHVTRWAGELHVKTTDSKMQALASEERSFLGVRASGVVADEVGVWESRDAWDAIVQSTVSKTQPLTLAITTAPAHKMTFAYEKFSWAEKILRGVVQADHVFAAIYRIDDGDDPMDIVKLRKANPSLGSILPEEHIRKQIAELADSPSGLNNFLQFHANVTPERTLQRQGSISTKKWDACHGFALIGETDPKKATMKFLAMNSDTPCYLGVDIGLKNDLTAIAMLFPKARFTEGAEPIDRPTVIVQCFAPEDGLLEKERAWGVPLSVWARESWLDLIPGDMVDLRTIKQFVIDLNTRFRVMETGFDPWGFPVQAAELNESGITCVRVDQVPSQLTAPCQELLGAVQRGDLVHFGSPIMAWMAGNVVMAEGEKHGGIKPEKLSASEKIDGIAAIVTAWHRYLGNPPAGIPRMYFIQDDNSVTKSGPNGLTQVYGPLSEAAKGSVAQDN